MSYARNKRKKVRAGEEGGEDRISRLPDDLIHHILSFTHTNLAVQTCILSKRWQQIWATLPHLNLDKSNFGNCAKFSQFLTHFFSRRNHQYDICTVNLYSENNVSLDLLQMIVSYAIAHNVQNLSIDTSIPIRHHMPLSILRHNSLKTLRILEVFRKSPPLKEGLCWWLPALTVLHISCCDLPESFLNLPALTTLCLGSCTLPKSFSSLPALTNLHLKNVRIYEDKRMYFSELVNLKNLTLEGCIILLKVINVSSLQLTNLTIKDSREVDKFVISAPKLSDFNHSGALKEYVFPWTLTSLQRVNLEMIRGYFFNLELNEVAARLICLLPELQNAKFLTITRDIIEALKKVPDLLDQHSSPLKNLKFLKVKDVHKFSRTTIPSHVRTYLLSGSPSATIVKEFPKTNECLAFAVVSTGVQIACLDKDEPQGTPSEPRPVGGNLITNVDAVILPCAQSRGRGKSLVSDNKPLLIQNVEYEGGVRESVENNSMACARTRSDHEHVKQSSKSPALDKVEGTAKVVEGAGKEVKERVVVNDDEEQVEAQDRHIEVGVDEETFIVEDMVDYLVKHALDT